MAVVISKNLPETRDKPTCQPANAEAASAAAGANFDNNIPKSINPVDNNSIPPVINNSTLLCIHVHALFANVTPCVKRLTDCVTLTIELFTESNCDASALPENIAPTAATPTPIAAFLPIPIGFCGATEAPPIVGVGCIFFNDARALIAPVFIDVYKLAKDIFDSALATLMLFVVFDQPWPITLVAFVVPVLADVSKLANEFLERAVAALIFSDTKPVAFLHFPLIKLEVVAALFFITAIVF